ncbi:holo-ACP synthase [Sphingobium boeckii]|uniref:Holo-[acyl-carrier-protein] synthase n=1 Tax=Sphingobium boeckii TaxID=1082345 RepID=A0A7W9ALV4_9SPHN|nr:holo-ACP synthase [Sphingobium boeckii]MBB5687837.1 holo-[acyl-carrier protein] synthase [Sphingobium boeckii]
MTGESVFGIGLDLVDLDRFARFYGGDDIELLETIFTAEELALVGNGARRIERLAARRAVKEAAYKAIGGGTGLADTQFEVIGGGSEPPSLLLHGAAKDRADALGVSRFLVSITHSDFSAAAVVVAFSGGPR